MPGTDCQFNLPCRLGALMHFEDEPTGFHLIMLLNSDISCSSVHVSEQTLPVPNFVFMGVDSSSSACSIVSPVGVDAALEGWRTFFLGGMSGNLFAAE